MQQITLLEVQASVRQQDSVSRKHSTVFIDTWRSYHPEVRHIVRDVRVNLPTFPTEFWAKANHTLPEMCTPEIRGALAISDDLIDKLLGADYIVLAVSMYNFSIPANFQVYIDNVVRVGRTFTFDRETLTFSGLASSKKVLLISPSAANYAPSTPMAAMDFCKPYV